jgi:Glycosyl hydrolase family 9/Cellulase N-terminal ig-like domain
MMAGLMTSPAAKSASLLLLAALFPVLSRASLPSVTVVATVPTAAVDGSSNGILTFSRTGDTSSALTVNFDLSGTAAKWTDYYRLPEGDMPVSVSIPAGAASVTLPITGKGNSSGANPETAVFTVEADSSYAAGSPATATLTIVPAGSIAAVTVATTTVATSGTPAVSSMPSVAMGATIAGAAPTDSEMDYTNLVVPAVGDHALRVLTPTILEVRQLNTKAPDPAIIASWNLVDSSGNFKAPAVGEFTVLVDGQPVAVTGVGFRRRVFYAPLKTYDLRIDNALYLQLASPVADSQLVVVTNPDASVWSPSDTYSVVANPLRYSPAIHVNQEGYVPSFPKVAMVGYYLGDLGELPLSANTFNVIDVTTNKVVYQGQLTLRQDVGYQTAPLPYQNVYVADFSSFTAQGEYQVQIEGMGTSIPFLINDGIAMAFARTYALGMYEQRSGTATVLPFTRFTHAADHTAPAQVPSNDGDPQFAFTWSTIKGYATTVNSNNPAQTAPLLVSEASSLYPFVNTGTVDVSGGHWDAGDYSKYTENSAELVHYLVFSVDSIPGVAAMDNLGIAESGDGIPDVLQEAKWEADFLAKMQDADGGFYFLVYPKDREYESNVLPENGDPQVVWPKNTSVTAAAVAALAEAASSPAMKKFYPAQSAVYLQKAQLGWQFLQSAIAKYGKAGAYQKLTFYSDDWTHDDELAWAASAMYAATGSAQYQAQLFAWFPNPADTSTFRWGWWRMSEGWGNAIRTYAFAARSGRLPQSALDPTYLAACEAQVVAAGDDAVTWSANSAYASPFPPETKAVLGGGWYFSLDQASDMAVAYQISPKPAYVQGLVGAMNYEGGTNPVNVTYLTGLGVKRQRENVSQFAQNSRRILPPTGIPLGQVTAAFEYLPSYGSELSELSYPTDSGTKNTYPYYDRWSDDFNVTQEFITVNQARSFMATAFLAGLTTSSTASWTPPLVSIKVPSGTALLNSPVTLTLNLGSLDITGARVVWEGRDQQPAFGSTFSFTPVNDGDQWVEAEVEWPDGRRVFAENDFQANSPLQVWIDDALPAGAAVGSDGGDSWNWVSSNPTPKSGSLAAQTTLASGLHEIWFTGASGAMQVLAGDTLFAWVYLDSANPPSEVMVAWNDGSSWEHRAYWGADSITYGTDGTTSRHYMGPLPAAGGWVKLSVPASTVGVEGVAVSGMDFSLEGGRATWDCIGRASASQ